jgi:mono/diheme cytochrome c family protein
MKSIILLAGFLSGCVYNVSPPEFASDHPANPNAGSAPLPVLARSLQSYDLAAAPDPQAPEMDHGSMDHGSMKDMEHGSMNHRSMKGMQGGEEKQEAMNHEAMGHESKKAADPSSKKSDSSMKDTDHSAMKGMDHGSMKGMDHGAHWMAPPDAARRKNPVPADGASIERGKKVFDANCVSCHGKEGRGDGPAAAALSPKPADLKAMARQHSDGDYAWKIANGRGAMPAWQGVLDDKQIWDVVNYVQSLGGSKSTGHDHSKHKH